VEGRAKLIKPAEYFEAVSLKGALLAGVVGADADFFDEVYPNPPCFTLGPLLFKVS